MQGDQQQVSGEDMAGNRGRGSIRTDILLSQMERNKADVDKIVETTNGMINPFEYEEELLQITSSKFRVYLIQNLHSLLFVKNVFKDEN